MSKPKNRIPEGKPRRKLGPGCFAIFADGKRLRVIRLKVYLNELFESQARKRGAR